MSNPGNCKSMTSYQTNYDVIYFNLVLGSEGGNKKRFLSHLVEINKLMICLSNLIKPNLVAFKMILKSTFRRGTMHTKVIILVVIVVTEGKQSQP
jgi:hypothetical protein